MPCAVQHRTRARPLTTGEAVDGFVGTYPPPRRRAPRSGPAHPVGVLEGFDRKLRHLAGAARRRSLASPHGREGAVDCARGRRRQAPDAADRRPGQAGRSVRWNLPHDRLCAVQPGERRVPEDRRADAVQVALARPAHHQDLAHVDAARQLRGARAGAAAPRAALVRRIGRRDLPELQPDQRRAARLRHRLRRGPHLPDGSGADGRRPHRVGRRGDGGRHPPAAVDGRPVRGDRGRPGRPPDPGVPGEAHRRGRACPTRPTRSTRRWATTSSPPTCSAR